MISSKSSQKTVRLKNFLMEFSNNNPIIKEEYEKIIDLFQNFKSKIIFLIDDELVTNPNKKATKNVQ